MISCEHILYFTALAERELTNLGYGEWPLQSADYAELLLHADIAFDLRVDVGWEVDDIAF
ncbi:MAG: hypothetical protein GY759_23300 [Chloroflexi bacterium]|nr:hypothetical protein [Chloroflexota bacterium]